jgi:hypothetical protein
MIFMLITNQLNRLKSLLRAIGLVHKSTVLLLLGLFASQEMLADLAPPAGSSRVYVQIRANEKAAVVNNILGAGGTIHHEFDHLGAVAATLPDRAIEALGKNPSVRLVEPDPVRYLFTETTPAGITAVQADTAWSTTDRRAGGYGMVHH